MFSTLMLLCVIIFSHYSVFVLYSACTLALLGIHYEALNVS